MVPEHIEIWKESPPAPIQNLDALVDHPKQDHNQEKVASDDLLLMGMMTWMQQGAVLDWLRPEQKKKADEEPEERNGLGPT